MDDDTTLLLWGDHGMTPDGAHGGETTLEMRSVIFSYRKTPWPMYEHYNKKEFKEIFKDMDRNIKHLDLTPILSMLLNLPFPFSNVGLFHPIFA